MSTFYKIGEIAALYGISTDILRYYEELGILVPRRAPNGYRVYRGICWRYRECHPRLKGAGLFHGPDTVLY